MGPASIQFVGVLEEHQQVEMGQSPLLIFDRPDTGWTRTKDPMLEDLLQHLLLLEPEDPGGQIRAIDRLLIPDELPLNLRPVGIRRHGGVVAVFRQCRLQIGLA